MKIYVLQLNNNLYSKVILDIKKYFLLLSYFLENWCVHLEQARQQTKTILRCNSNSET